LKPSRQCSLRVEKRYCDAGRAFMRAVAPTVADRPMLPALGREVRVGIVADAHRAAAVEHRTSNRLRV
jgi:hypothetical protein